MEYGNFRFIVCGPIYCSAAAHEAVGNGHHADDDHHDDDKQTSVVALYLCKEVAGLFNNCNLYKYLFYCLQEHVLHMQLHISIYAHYNSLSTKNI